MKYLVLMFLLCILSSGSAIFLNKTTLFQTISEIDLSGRKIDFIDSNTFEDLTNLKKLNLNSNLISFIDANLFKKLVNLEELWLESNNIIMFDVNALAGLIHLGKVCIHNNPISKYFPDRLAQICKTNPKCSVKFNEPCEDSSTLTTTSPTTTPSPIFQEVLTIDDPLVSFTVLKNGNLLTFSILDFINEWNVTGGLVNSVSYSNLIVSFSDLENGNILAGRADGPIEILNSSLTTLQTLYGHSEYVKVILTLSYDSFASGSKDDSIKIWKNNMSNESWTCVYTLKGHNGDILDLVLSTKANTLISASSDSTIKIWNFKTGQLIESLLSHQAPVNSLVGLKNNQFAAGSDDTEITIWNLNNTTKVKTLNATSQVNVLAVSKNWLISGTNKDNSLTIWNADTFEKIRIIRLNSEKITSLAVWNDNFLVVGSFGKGAIIISI